MLFQLQLINLVCYEKDSYLVYEPPTFVESKKGFLLKKKIIYKMAL